MDIHKLRLIDIFTNDYIYDYTTNRNILFNELLRTNASLFILERIRLAPLDLFLPFGSIFLSTIIDSLLDTCIMGMWRVSVDGAFENGLTLRKFKNQILKNLKNNELKSVFREELKPHRFEKRVREFEKQISDIRHNHIAHLNKQKYPLFTVKGIKWDINSSSALMEYQLELNRFFDFMQFEEKRGLQWAEYDEIHHIFGDDYQPDIDKFLDQIIQSSRIFNAIEKEPDYWKTIQSRLSKEQILTIIHYRRLM